MKILLRIGMLEVNEVACIKKESILDAKFVEIVFKKQKKKKKIIFTKTNEAFENIIHESSIFI